MSNKKKRKNKKLPHKALIYARYIIPIVLCFATMLVTLIPCLTYSIGEEVNAPISAKELFGNSWDQVRAYLFNTAEQDPAQHSFSGSMLIYLILFALLFTLGMLSTVIVAVCVFRYISRRDRSDKVWLWFITIVPNRIVVCILQGLTLPVLFLSRMIIPMYEKMNVSVTLTVNGLEPWVWGLIFFAVSVVFSVISAYYEKDSGADPFKKPEAPIVKVVARDDEEIEKERVERPLSQAEKRKKDEQAEIIRKLLNKDDEENT